MTGVARWRWLLACAATGLVSGFAGYSIARSDADRRRPPSDRATRDAPSHVDAPRLGESGSLFYRFVSPLEPPPLARETVLLTPRPRADECTDGCPPGLLVVGADRGRQKIQRLVASLEPALLALATHHQIPGEMRAGLRERLRGDTWDPQGPREPIRVLGNAEPRPDLGDRNAVVGLAIYDSHDPFFDTGRRSSVGGGLLLIARREWMDSGGDDMEVIEGFVEVAEPGREDRELPTIDSGLARMYPPGMNHFRALGDVVGIHLDPAGDLFVYDESFVERRLDAGPDLVALVRFLVSRA